jgi:hypothetical protein
MRAGAPSANNNGGTLSDDSVIAWLPRDAGHIAAAQPSERGDAVVPCWDQIIPPRLRVPVALPTAAIIGRPYRGTAAAARRCRCSYTAANRGGLADGIVGCYLPRIYVAGLVALSRPQRD